MTNFPFERLQADLAKLIAGMPAGSRLVSEPELSKQLGVSRATLREAMRTFESQGLIRRRQGSGTYVVGHVPALDAGLETLESIDRMARRLGLEVSVSNLLVEEIPADVEQAHGLGVRAAAKLTRIQRVIREEKRPVAYLIDTLPEEYLKPGDLPATFNGSVLDFLLERGDPLTVSRTAIGAVVATADVAKPLEIQRGDVLLKIIAQLYRADGKVVDYSTSYFIPGYFNFHVVRKVGIG